MNEMLAILDGMAAYDITGKDTPEATVESPIKEPHVEDEPAPVAQKAAASRPKPPKSKGDDASTAFWQEYEKALDEYKGKTMEKHFPRVAIDYDVAETLRLIKGADLKCIVNAALKAMIVTYRDELKKSIAPKPKFLV